MYNSYFGFLESPFENTLDQKFLFLSDDHREVLAALLYFIKEEKGFAIFCGDVGTGKTMLINAFLDKMPKSVQPIIISNPRVLFAELLHYLAKTLQVKATDKTTLELADEVKQALMAARQSGIVHLLIVDEAHLLSDDSLEDIRLLSNLETQEQKLLQILLVGQYELSFKLDRPEMRQLRQRINISRFLSPLDAVETIHYLNHRLAKVGADFDSCFEPHCRRLIFKMTDGVPRRINQLCDSALLICLNEGLKKVNRRILKKAEDALLTDRLLTPKSSQRKAAPANRKRRKILLPAVGGLALLLAGGFLAQNGLWGKKLPFLPGPQPTAVARAPGQAKADSGKVSPEPGSGPADSGISAKNVPAGTIPDAHAEKSTAESSVSAKIRGYAPQIPPAVAAGPETAATPIFLAPGYLPTASPGPDKLAFFVPTAAQTVVAKGDNLEKVATRWYPGNVDLGMEAIVLANLKNSKRNLFRPGQRLLLPKLNSARRIIQLRDLLFYAPYVNYRSFDMVQQTMARLHQKKVRYVVVNSTGSDGAITRRIFLGGYELAGDLEWALKLLEPTPGSREAKAGRPWAKP
jgi:type II secretory pathway predicted ATPase ExeA